MAPSLTRAATVVAVVALLLGAAPVSTRATTAPPTAGPQELVEGRGLFEKATCILCVAAFVAASGGTVAGAIIVGVTFPEYAAACGLTCVNAYT